MTTPWLSVVVPVHDGARYLGEALGSVAAQGDALDGVEVVAVDDGSTDESPDVLASFTDRLPLRVLSPGRLGSWVAATNHGIAASSGRSVCFLHQDDRWRPGRLAAVRAAAAGGERFVVHDTAFIGPDGRVLGPWRHRLTSGGPGTNVAALLVQNVLAIGAPVVPRALFDATGPLDPTLWYTADWDCWLRAAARHPTVVVPGVHAEFRVHPASQTVVGSGDGAAFRSQLEQVLDRHAGALPEGPRRDRTLRMARASVDVNVALAGGLAGGATAKVAALRPLLRSGPVGSVRLVRAARLHERVSARLRAGLAGDARRR